MIVNAAVQAGSATPNRCQSVPACPVRFFQFTGGELGYKMLTGTTKPMINGKIQPSCEKEIKAGDQRHGSGYGQLAMTRKKIMSREFRKADTQCAYAGRW